MKFGPERPKSALKLGFLPFSQFGSLVFLEIRYNDSLQQFLTSSRGTTHKKNFGDQIWAKVEYKTRFFCHFLRFGSLVFLEIAYNDSLQQCITPSRGKNHKKIFWEPNLGQKGAKSDPN